MSPAAGDLVVAMAKATKLLRFAAKTASKYARKNIPAYINGHPTFVYARLAQKHPIHPAAFLRQTRRFLSTTRSTFSQALRQFDPVTEQTATARARYGSSRVAFAVSQSTGHSPFASTLRPNLTGGAFPRTAGGYSLGSGRMGGRRFFSHTPQAPAQVIQNVSQGMRAFLLGGKKVQYDGVDRHGEKRFRAVTPLQDKATKKIAAVPKATPGSFIDFNINPTITALAPLTSVAGYNAESADGLHTEGLLDILSTDFSRSLRELAIVLADIKALSSLGDLPISYQQGRFRIHFPGTDPETVERLASELAVRRGVVGQDPDFDAFVGTEIALLFPFAPSVSSNSPASLFGQTAYVIEAEFDEESSAPDFSDSPTTLSDTGHAYEDLDELSNPWLGESPEGALTENDVGYSSAESPRRGESPLEYSDFEGLYRFIEMCDRART